MKILITGANGYVGTGLVKNLYLEEHVIIPVGFDAGCKQGSFYNLDLTDMPKTCSYIANVRPDVIIHLAGNKDVIKCESDKMFSRQINYEMSKNIVEQCALGKIRLIYISTDYVFNGADGPFSELSCPVPATQYGKDKLAIESFVRGTLSEYAIVRSAGVFGLKKDFVETVIKTLMQGSVFRAYTNLKNSPTFIKDLSSMLRIIITNKKYTGIFHCAGPESLSRYDFALKIAKVFGFEKNLIVSEKLNLLSDIRPPDLSMDCKQTYEVLRYCPNDIESILRSHIGIWKELLYSKDGLYQI